jgi:F-type H+-transporting ATPase subunit gamma
LFKAVLRWRGLVPAGVNVDAIAWGRKAISFLRRNNATKVVRTQEKVLEKPSYDFAKASAKELVDLFLEHKYDQIFLVYPKFVSAMAQIATVEQLLPVTVAKPQGEQGIGTNFDVEPDFAELLDTLLERKLVGTIYKAMLESAASEHGARMSAMDSATRNAKEVVKKLTLKYNRARQALITTELTEIISGAQALN